MTRMSSSSFVSTCHLQLRPGAFPQAGKFRQEDARTPLYSHPLTLCLNSKLQHCGKGHISLDYLPTEEVHQNFCTCFSDDILSFLPIGSFIFFFINMYLNGCLLFCMCTGLADIKKTQQNKPKKTNRKKKQNQKKI